MINMGRAKFFVAIAVLCAALVLVEGTAVRIYFLALEASILKFNHSYYHGMHTVLHRKKSYS